MQNKHFYSHLIEIESLSVELDQMDLSETERAHLASLIDSNLHHTILDAIFSELSEDDKQELVEKIGASDHDKIWEFLNKRVDNVEEKIKKAVKELKDELHKDVKRSKTLRQGSG